MTSPLVSVVIINRNHGDLIAKTLMSYLNQSFNDFEIICIDGKSKDDSLKIIAEFSNVKVYSEKDRSGAEAFAKGIKLAKSKYLMLGNSTDILLDKKFIESAINILESNDKIALVFGKVATFNNSIDDLTYLDSYKNNRFGNYQKNFITWLKTGETFHEHACIIRKNVLDIIFPDLTTYQNYIYNLPDDLFLTFRILFHKNGFRAEFIDYAALAVVDHKNRVSVDQRNIFLKHLGVYNRSLNDYRKYLRKTKNYRFKSIDQNDSEKLQNFAKLKILLFLEWYAFKRIVRKMIK